MVASAPLIWSKFADNEEESIVPLLKEIVMLELEIMLELSMVRKELDIVAALV